MDIEQRKTSPRTRQGLVIVHTGLGKGKTTAALGLLFRAWGHGLRLCVIQFIKRPNQALGEVRAARRLDIEWHQMGDGFTWRSSDRDETKAKARRAWALVQDKIAAGGYDLIVLDELTFVFKYGWLNAHKAVAWLRAFKPPALHLVITGRGAPAELIEYADLVTEMTEIKHPFAHGIKAQAGIEF